MTVDERVVPGGVVLTITVDGAPVTQGSKKIGRGPGGRPVLVEDRDAELGRWRGAVAAAARDALGPQWVPIEDPVDVELSFLVARPPSHLTARGELRAGAPLLPCTRSSGDGDKLARAVLDALSHAKFWADDARAVDIAIRKRYAAPAAGQRPGVRIVARAATP